MKTRSTIGLTAVAGAVAAVLLAVWLGLRERDPGERGTPPAMRGAEAPEPRPPAELEPAARPPGDTLEDAGRTRIAGPEPAPVEPDTAPSGAADLLGPFSVSGRLLDLTGAEVHGRRVAFRDRKGQERKAVLDVEGARYQIAGLEPGHWWVTATARGHRDASAELELYSTDEGVHLDLVLEPRSTLDVLVFTPSGASLFEAAGEDLAHELRALHAIESAEPLPERYEPTAEERQRFVTDVHTDAADPLRGMLELEAAPPVLVSLLLGDLVVASKRAPAGSEEVRFTLGVEEAAALFATLRLQVLDSSGAPVQQASVLLESPFDSLMTTGRSEGRFEIAHLKPGNFELSITLVPGHRILQRTVVLGPGLTDLGAIRLERAEGIRAIVVDPGGNPLTGTGTGDLMVRFARILPATGEPEDPSVKSVLESRALGLMVDEEGFIDLELLAPARYLIEVQGKEWISRPQEIDLEAPPAGDVQIVVYPPSVVVLTLDEGDWTGLTYRLLDEAGLAASAGRLEDPAPVRIPAAPGPYRLVLVEEDGALVLDEAFELGAETLTIHVAL